VEKQAIDKPHRVMRLEPADTHGRFTKSSLFADHLMFPEGCLWLDGSLYVSAPPSIWKLTDPNGDGLADERSEWHQGKTLTGCANDLHGPYLGLDGLIYWCKGAFARQTYERPGGKPFTTRASHIFRAAVDHSQFEAVLTAGMDNPVGVVFDLSGEPFMCGTFLLHPEAGKRDGVVHAVYGGVYGKSNDVLDDHPKTGDLMPIMTHLGAAAPCSVIRYGSDTFGSEYRNNLFVCCFNMHKITKHVLEPAGATFKTKDSDFLVSDNSDFHPTDVIEDADGSLIVIDTGGWYKLCCPTSQLSKPDVLGAIYRIRRSNSSVIADPRGLQITWDKLTGTQAAQLLEDPRTAVRKRALDYFAKAGAAAAPALTDGLKSIKAADARANVVWALTRIDAPAARSAVRSALSDASETVKHAAAHSAGLWRDSGAKPQLLQLLESSNPQLQRVAAEALGRIGDKSVVPALLHASSRSQDRFLQHSLIYALIEINAPAETGQGLSSQDTAQKRSALIALDQMDKSELQSQTVTPLLNSSDESLRQAALWVAGHHPDWGHELAGFFKARLQERALSDSAELKNELSQLAHSEAIQELIGSCLSSRACSSQSRQLLLETIALTSQKEPPQSWVQGTTASLTDADEQVLRAAVTAARTLNQAKNKPPELSAPLLHLAGDPAHSDDLRLTALAAMSSSNGALGPDLLTLVFANLDPAKPVLTRGNAAAILAKSKLTDDELIGVAEHLKKVGPLEATKLLETFQQSTNELVGTKLVESLRDSKALTSLRPDVLQKLLEQFPSSVQEQGKELIVSLNADAAKQSAHIDQLLSSIGKGDIRSGQAVFNSQKAACSSCHAMGYLGGRVGPDLTTIGQIRTERDLLESIVYPRVLCEALNRTSLRRSPTRIIMGFFAKMLPMKSCSPPGRPRKSASTEAKLPICGREQFRLCPQEWSNSYRGRNWQIWWPSSKPPNGARSRIVQWTTGRRTRVRYSMPVWSPCK
jgi:putative membrane-bound dehydrogenase-like protein